MGLVKVKVVEGRDLGSVVRTELVDAYVKLSLNTHSETTKVIVKTDKPEWNETFYFEVSDSEKDNLHIVCKDKLKASASIWIGQALIPIKDLISDQSTSKWFPLYKDDSYTLQKGEIQLEIEYNSSGEIPKESSKLSIKSFLHINEDEEITEPKSPSGVFKTALSFAMKNLSPEKAYEDVSHSPPKHRHSLTHIHHSHTMLVEFDKQKCEVAIDTSRTVFEVLLSVCTEIFQMPEDLVPYYDLLYTLKDGVKTLLNKNTALHDYRIHFAKATFFIDKAKHLVRKNVQVQPPTFKSFHEKFNLDSSRNRNDVLFEYLLYCCNDVALVQLFRDKLNVTEYDDIVARVKANSVGVESMLIELEHRAMSSNVFYNASNFQTEQEFEEWRRQERAAIVESMDEVIFKDPEFYGTVLVSVKEAKGLEAKDATGTSDPYVVVSLENERVISSYKKKTLNPVWNEIFDLEATSPNSLITIEVFDKDYLSADDFIAQTSVSLTSLKQTGTVNSWFNLQPQGSIHLEIKLNFAYSKYYRKLFEMPGVIDDYDPQSIKGITPEFLNHNAFYVQLQNILQDYKDENVTKEFLETYAKRYGVGYLFTRLTALQRAIEYINESPDSYEAVAGPLIDVVRLKSSLWTKSETEMFAGLKKQLRGQVYEYAHKFKKLFPDNKPEGAFDSLLEILLQLNDGDFASQIKEIFKKSLLAEFEEIEISVKTNKSESFDGVPLDTLELIELVRKVQIELSRDITYKDSLLVYGVDMAPLAVGVYYERLNKIIAGYGELSEYSADTFELYFRIKNLYQMFSQYSGEEHAFDFAPIKKVFSVFIFGWLKETRDKLMDWTKKSFDVDKFEKLTDTEQHSSSVLDVFQGITESFQFLQRIDMKDTFLFISFTEIIAEVVDLYINLLSKDVEAKLLQDIQHRQSQQKSSEMVAFKVTSQVCVQLNNLENIRFQLDTVAGTIEAEFSKSDSTEALETIKTTFDKCLHQTFLRVKRELNRTIRFINTLTNQYIQHQMLLAVKEYKSSEAQTQLKLLYDYLDDQLAVLHDNLYADPFKRLLQSLWDLIGADLKDIILPDKQTSVDLDIDTAHYIVKILEELQDYFHADGAGLNHEYLREHSSEIRRLLELFEQSTQQLIKSFTSSDTEADNELIKRVLQTRAHEDKEASAFLSEYEERDKMIDTKTDLQKIRENFMLGENELVLDKYHIRSHSKAGFLYLTSNYVLFDTYSMSGPDADIQIAIPLKDIFAISREKHKFVLDLVRIVTTKGEEYIFTSLVNRAEMIQEIVQQAKKIGNTNKLE